MRKVSPLIRAALLGAAFFVGGSAAVRADPVAPALLAPAFDVYIDKMAAIHAGPATCPAAKPAADYVGNWPQAKAIFLSSLWADGFPTDFVRGATTRLDAAPGTIKADCADAATVAYLADPSKADWVEVVEDTLTGSELNIFKTPLDPKIWNEIKGMVAKDLPLEKRLLDCVAASDPIILPSMVQGWDAMIVKLGGQLVGAGLPRDEINAMLTDAEANALWHRAAADAEAPLQASCAKDLSWQKRLVEMSSASVGPAAAKLLPLPPADAESN